MNQLHIAVVGNCQSAALARAIRFFVPGSTVQVFTLDELPGRFAGSEAMLAELDKYGLVVAQPYGPDHFPELDGARLKTLRDRVIQFPSVEFSAFHPDCIYVVSHRDGLHFVPSPLGDYNSALALLGYNLGLSVDETVGLFNEDVYERAGYFRVWGLSEEVLLGAGRAVGFPIERLYHSWMRRGCFMHSVNHPKLFVIADVAGALLEQGGIPMVCRSVENHLPDQALFSSVWPIYPEIGRRMGLEGTYLFKKPTVSDEQSPIITLQEFVCGSYASYRGYPPGTMHSMRVDEWMGKSKFIEYIVGRRSTP